eukprot:scaffold19927_cov65-Phaeocystis_antarctica.AAC.7
MAYGRLKRSSCNAQSTKTVSRVVTHSPSGLLGSLFQAVLDLRFCLRTDSTLGCTTCAATSDGAVSSAGTTSTISHFSSTIKRIRRVCIAFCISE